MECTDLLGRSKVLGVGAAGEWSVLPVTLEERAKRVSALKVVAQNQLELRVLPTKVVIRSLVHSAQLHLSTENVPDQETRHVRLMLPGGVPSAGGRAAWGVPCQVIGCERVVNIALAA